MSQVEVFSKEQFERALPVDKDENPLWSWLEPYKGEYVYEIRVLTNGQPTNKRIVVRSSVRLNGESAGTGKDSIRAWCEYWYPTANKWVPLGKGDTTSRTHRTGDWRGRLTDKLRDLYKLALADNGKRVWNKPLPPTKRELAERKSEKVEGDLLGFLENSSQQESPDDIFDFLGTESEVVESAPTAPVIQPNERQCQAIEADPNEAVLIVAPAGSGKTATMSKRYGFLIESGARPESIAAVTFSRDMADELKNRIENENPGISETSAGDKITTIHALCKRILVAEGDRRQVPGRRSKIKNWQVKQALIEIIDDIWTDVRYRPNWKEVLGVINSAKAAGLDSNHDMVLFGDIEDIWGHNVGEELHIARQDFDNWLSRNNVITFSDMLFDVEMRLRDDENFRTRWQTRFEYILIDEGQDTSAQAMRILTILAAPQNNIILVGDDAQLLYRFANATPEYNLFGFKDRYPNANRVFLNVNYRSTLEIIEKSNRLIAHNYERECRDCNGEGESDTCTKCGGTGRLEGAYPAEYFKTVEGRPDAPQGQPIEFVQYDTAIEEANEIAKEIRAKLDSGEYSPDDFFVGGRTKALLGYYEGPFVTLGIPYINLAGSSFFGMKHIKDVICILRLAHNENDSEAFERVHNIASRTNTHPWGPKKGQYCQTRYLGRAFLKACYDSETRKPQYKRRWAAVKKKRSWAHGVDDLDYFIHSVQKCLEEKSVSETIDFIINECYEVYMNADEGIDGGDASENKMDDFETVKEIAAQHKTVEEFLKYTRAAERAAEAAKGGDWDGHVVLSTIHRLKGQERRVVYGPGMCEGFTKKGAPVGLLPHTYSMRPPTSRGALPINGMGRIEDERCIAFVLVSRAKEEVYLSAPRVYQSCKMNPSRFISEMGLI